MSASARGAAPAASSRRALILGSTLLVALCGPAGAVATLEGQVVSPHCGIRGPTGTTTSVQCTSNAGGASFMAAINPGETAFVTATLNYQYSDQGLPLAQPYPIQLDANGFAVHWVDHEVGTILPRSNLCQDRYCGSLIPPSLDLGGVGFPPIVLGENTSPDHFSGQVSLSSFVTVAGGANTVGYSTIVFVSWSGTAVSGLAPPVPEPGAWALLSAGLAGLVLTRLAGLSGLTRTLPRSPSRCARAARRSRRDRREPAGCGP